MELFHALHRLVTGHLRAALLILLLGILTGRGEPFSISQTDKDGAPSMSAWGKDSSENSHKPSASLSDKQESWRRFVLWFSDRNEPWNPEKKLLFDDQDLSASYSVANSGVGTFSVPAAISDATFELASIPMEDEVPAGGLSWDRSPEDVGWTTQFSKPAEMLETSSPATADARETGDGTDGSGSEAMRGPSKVEFSSTDSARVQAGSSDYPDGSSTADNQLILPPQGPIPQIATPEPTVTALWGISALLFACRRRLRSKS